MAIIYRGRVGGNYQYWNENDLVPSGATNITVVNVPALTASHVDRSVYAPDGISGSLTQLTGSTSYLIAGANITITSASNGPITISSTGGSSVVLVTGSASTNAGSPNAIVDGNILSASNGVWDGSQAVGLRQQFHVLGLQYDTSSNLNQFAATYLVMTHVNAAGVQTAIQNSLTEISRETTGSFVSGWDVNVNGDCSLAVTGYTDSPSVVWYAQRVLEMGLRQDGSRT
jgi:hypothetical protein